MKCVVKVDKSNLPEGELVYVSLLERAIPNGGSVTLELTSEQAKSLEDAHGITVSKETEKKGGDK